MLTCLALTGCSGGAEGSSRLPVYKVTGKVTLRGGPLIGATVAFAPKEKQPVAIGKTDDAGMYELTTYDPGDGAAKGDYAVTVNEDCLRVSDRGSSVAHGVDVKPSSAHGGKGAKVASDGNLVPADFADSSKTPVSFKVEEKDNVCNIDISRMSAAPPVLISNINGGCACSHPLSFWCLAFDLGCQPQVPLFRTR